MLVLTSLCLSGKKRRKGLLSNGTGRPLPVSFYMYRTVLFYIHANASSYSICDRSIQLVSLISNAWSSTWHRCNDGAIALRPRPNFPFLTFYWPADLGHVLERVRVENVRGGNTCSKLPALLPFGFCSWLEADHWSISALCLMPCQTC